MQGKEVSAAGDDLLALTIRPLASCWGIEDGKKEVPETQKIEEACSVVNDSKVHIVDEQGKELTQVSELSEDGTWYVLFDETGLSLDFGAMGKGIACDRVAESLKKIRWKALVWQSAAAFYATAQSRMVPVSGSVFVIREEMKMI